MQKQIKCPANETQDKDRGGKYQDSEAQITLDKKIVPFFHNSSASLKYAQWKKWTHYLFFLALLWFCAVPCVAQNSSTYGTITRSAPANQCTATGCVYFHLPPDTPWVTLNVAGTWSGTLNVYSITSPDATPQNLNSMTWHSMAPLTANGSWSVATGNAVFILVQATAFASGSATVTMASSQTGAPISNPIFMGTGIFSGVTVTGNVSAATVSVHGNLDASTFQFGNLIHAAAFGIVPDGQEVWDGSITSGSTDLYSASLTCNSSNVGNWIAVWGAGASGANLVTTISACISGGVQLATSASTTITADAHIATGGDETTQFQALHTYLLAHDGSIVVFSPGIYQYTYNTWLEGVKNVSIEGNGAEFRNISSSGYFANNAAFYLNPDYFSGYSQSPAEGNAPMYLIDTVASGASAITTATASDAGNIKPGDYILVAGYNQQNGGYPYNYRYFEIHRATSVNATTGVIEFAGALKYSYQSNWYASTVSGQSTPIGPAVVVDLDRTGTYAFTLAENVSFNNLSFLANPQSDGTHTYGDAVIVGARRFNCDKCTFGYLDPTMGGAYSFKQTNVYNGMEPDKLLDTLSVDDSYVNSIASATGVNNLSISNSVIQSGSSAAPRNLVLKGDTFLINGFGISSGGSLGWRTYNATVEGNTVFQNEASPGSGFYAGSGGAQSFTAATGSTSLIGYTYDWTSNDEIAPGSTIYTAGYAKSCIVQSISWDGTYQELAVTNCYGTPAAGDVWYYNTVGNVTDTGNYWGNDSKNNGILSASYVDHAGQTTQPNLGYSGTPLLIQTPIGGPQNNIFSINDASGNNIITAQAQGTNAIRLDSSDGTHTELWLDYPNLDVFSGTCINNNQAGGSYCFNSDGSMSVEDSAGHTVVTFSANGVVFPGLTTASLPSCTSTSVNSINMVTDATAFTPGSAPTGGGTYSAPVYCQNHGGTYSWIMY